MLRLIFLLGAAAVIMAAAWHWSDRQTTAPERWLGDDGFYRLNYAALTTGTSLAGIPLPGAPDPITVPTPQSSLDLKNSLFHDPGAPVGGNPQGKITIVEFFDYRCTYCKAVAPKLARLVERDVRVRLIYKEWPILGGSSVLAAKAALAAHRQGKYESFHRRMMAVTGIPTMGLIQSLADELGLEWARLQQDMADPQIENALVRTKQLASRIGIVGTPAFVAGNTIVQGAVDPQELLSLAEEAVMRADAGVKTSDTPPTR